MKLFSIRHALIGCLGCALYLGAAERTKRFEFKFWVKKEKEPSTRSSSGLARVPTVQFRVDPRYAEWHTNRIDLIDSMYVAGTRGDFLAQEALAFKAAYGEFFYKYFADKGPTGDTALRRQSIQKQIIEAKRRLKIQEEFKNEDAVKQIRTQIKGLEEADAELAKEVPEQRLAGHFVIPDREHTLGGLLFLIAYSEGGNERGPAKEDGYYLKELRGHRLRLAEIVTRDDPPAEVKRKALMLNETLLKIGDHLLRGEVEHGQKLAHDVASEMLNQE